MARRSLKGTVHPKWSFYEHLLTLVSFRSQKDLFKAEYPSCTCPYNENISWPWLSSKIFNEQHLKLYYFPYIKLSINSRRIGKNHVHYVYYWFILIVLLFLGSYICYHKWKVEWIIIKKLLYILNIIYTLYFYIQTICKWHKFEHYFASNKM